MIKSDRIVKKSHKNVNLCPSDKTQTYFQIYELLTTLLVRIKGDRVSNILSEKTK